MGMDDKQLSNPFSTGGGGGHFEAHVQASFVALMLTGGYAPCLPCWPITEIKLQGKIDGYDTDDLIVFVDKIDSKERCKLLGQVKHSIRITQGDRVFSEVIQATWNDFNNPRVFTKGKDVVALITGPLSATDSHNVQGNMPNVRPRTSCAPKTSKRSTSVFLKICARKTTERWPSWSKALDSKSSRP